MSRNAVDIKNKEWINDLSKMYPNFIFKTGKCFKFRPPKTIYVDNKNSDWYKLLTLHELGHALCGHKNFIQDISRIKMEREAWEKARILCQKFQVNYDEEFVENQLDTYRDWLHNRSRCPRCGLTCYQKKDGKYCCPRCDFLTTRTPV